MFGFLIYPFEPTCGLLFSPCTFANARAVNARRNTRTFHIIESRNIFPRCGKLRDLPPMSFDGFSRCYHFVYTVAISIIILSVAPFKVRFLAIDSPIVINPYKVIMFVLVLMVYAREVVWIWKKCHSNKSVYWDIYAETATMDSKIVPSHLRFQYFWFTGVPITNTQHPSKVANLVNALVFGRVFPDFLFLHTKSKFMFKANIIKIHEKGNRAYFTTIPDCPKL